MATEALSYEINPFPNKEQSVIVMRAVVPDSCPLHAHSFIEIAYIEKGNGMHQVNQQLSRVKRGDFFIINTHIPHSFLSTSKQDEPLTVINCIFSPEFIDNALLGCTDFIEAFYHFFFENFVVSDGEEPNFLSFSDTSPFRFESLFTEMLSEYEKQLPGWQTVIKSCLTTFIIQVLRAGQNSAAGENLSDGRRRIVENTILYIREHYKQDIRLDEMAANVYLSPSYLSRMFKQYTNQTLTQFIQNERIDAVLQGLSTTDKSIEVLADESGYRDMKTFYKAFRQITGTTPGIYRKEKAAMQKTP